MLRHDRDAVMTSSYGSILPLVRRIGVQKKYWYGVPDVPNLLNSLKQSNTTYCQNQRGTPEFGGGMWLPLAPMATAVKHKLPMASTKFYC